jgi:hypothetical protein
MRNISKCLGVLVIFLAVASYAFAQATPAPALQADKTFQGTLIKIDTDAKTLVARDADNKEMSYSPNFGQVAKV